MRLTLDARTRRFLRRLPALNPYSAAELALLALLAVQGARLAWALATPVTPIGDWRPATPTVAGDPTAILTGFNPFFRLSADAGSGTVTALPLQLFGIRLDEASGRGAAIVAGPDGVQKSVAVGEEVMPGVKLTAVAFDHISIDRGGAAEDLFLDQSGATPAAPAPGAASAAPLLPTTAGATPAVSPAAPAADLRQQVAVMPRIDNGRVTGLTLGPKGTGDAFRAAGLREGDVVTAIGGEPVRSMADADRLAQGAAAGGKVAVAIERNGQTIQLSVPGTVAGGTR